MHSLSLLVKSALRLATTAAGVSAMVWAWSVVPALWHERGIIDVSRAIIAGQSFKPTVLAAVDNPDVDEGRL